MATSWHPSPDNISKRCQHFEHFSLRHPEVSSSICNSSEAQKNLKFQWWNSSQQMGEVGGKKQIPIGMLSCSIVQKETMILFLSVFN